MSRLRYFAWILAFLLISSFTFSQTPDTVTLRGAVTDASGAAIVGANVTVENETQSVRRNTTTDGAGKFSVAGLAANGIYRVTARKEGFGNAVAQNLRFLAGATATVNMQMSPATQKTEIVVTGVAGEVRTDEPQIGIYLSREQMQEVPLPNRRITYLPLLNAANRPALNQGDIFLNQNLFTTNGAGRRQTWFEVDGSSAVDMWGRQTIFANLPLDSLQEMQVLTNAFSAEYGGTTGGVINIVTRPGSNGFHGSVVAAFRPPETSAKLWGYTATNAPNGNAITSDSMKQGALTLSGPLAKRTYAAVSGEYTSQNRTSPITSALSPVPSFEGQYRNWVGYARVDQNINDKNNVFLRLSADTFKDTNPSGTVGANSLPSVDRIYRRRTYTAQIGETAQLSRNLLNDLRAHFDLASPITQFDPVTPSTQIVVPIAGTQNFVSGNSQWAKLLNHQFGITDTIAATSGRHSLHFGGSVLYAHNGGNSKEFGGPLYLGQLTYKTCTPGATSPCLDPTFLASYINNIANVASYAQAYGDANYSVDDTLWSLFAQDDVRVARSLTVNLGLRYERQSLTDATHDFAPRVGFAYDVLGRGNTVVRGGYGIYYSTIPDNAAANWALSGPTGVFTYTAQPGQPGFPTSLTGLPLPLPTGVVIPTRSIYLRPGRASYYNQFLPMDTLIGYQDALLNPYSQQWTLGVERRLAPNWVLSVDYVGSHTLRINRPLDVNPPTSFVRTAQGQTRSAAAANCTRPFWVWWYAQNNSACGANPLPPYGLIQSDVNNGFANYNALDVNLRHRFSNRFDLLLSYTWSHAFSNVDADLPSSSQNPNDPRAAGAAEYGPSLFDQRHRFVVSGVYSAPFKINVGGVATLASALPFNLTTGTTNSGDTGATADRPVIDGVVVGRNAGRGRAIYDLSPFVERAFPLGSERVRLNVRAEAFNVFNHPNFVGYNGTYGNAAAAPATLGSPALGLTNQLPARSMQFSARLTF